MRIPFRLLGLGGAAWTAYTLLIRGALTLDLGMGRRVRPLGPIRVEVEADPETVFDVVSAPYLGRTPRAMQSKLEVLERGSDMVLAAHYTPVGRMVATTVETVRFERPRRVSFRLLRGPVPHAVETYELSASGAGTTLEYSGELGADLWGLGEWWADRVAAPWERTVEASLQSIRSESERRAAGSGRR